MTVDSAHQFNDVGEFMNLDQRAQINDLTLLVFNLTKRKIDQLADNQKITLRSLQEHVGGEVDLPQASVSAFVSVFVESYEECTLRKGRNGGVYKCRAIAPKPLNTCPTCGRRARRQPSGLIV